MRRCFSVLLFAAGLISSTAAAGNLTKVTGDHVDFYFEQNFEYFDTNEFYTVTGDTLTVNSHAIGTTSINVAWANFIVVPHNGYLLSNSIARQYSGYLARHGSDSDDYQILSAVGNIDSGTMAHRSTPLRQQ